MPVEETEMPMSIQKIKQIKEVLFSMRSRLQPVISAHPTGLAKPSIELNTPLFNELQDLLDVAETLRDDIAL